jgi:hypothetical protein
MSSAKLQILERKFAHQNPERIPAPAADDLTAAIQRLIDQRVEQALEQQPAKPSPHVQRLLDQQFNKPEPTTDYRQLPLVQKTAPKAPFNAIMHRDGAGQISWMEMSNGVKFAAIRDGAGKIIEIRQIDDSPVLPAPDIPFKAKARQYKDGEPR